MSMWLTTKSALSPAERAGEQGFGSWSAVAPVQGDDPPLLQLLELLAGAAGRDWHAYETLAQVGWRDAGQIENPDVGDPRARFSRFGSLLLTGFGLAELPDAGSGLEAGVRIGNEGESGLTLSGSAEAVEEVEVVKFYACDDPASVLRRQLVGRAGEGQVLVRCDGGCHFQVRLPGGGVVLAQAWVEEEGEMFGPGSTTFVFRRPGAGSDVHRRCREV